MSRISRFLKRRFYYHYSNKAEPEDFGKLEQTLARFRSMSLVLAFVLLFSIPWAFATLLFRIYEELYRPFTTPPLVFFPVSLFAFYLPSAFLDLIVIFPVMALIMRKLTGSHYEVYIRYAQMKDGWNWLKWAGIARKTFQFPFIITLVMVMTSRLIATQNGFMVHGLFDILPHSYPYTEIRKVVYYEGYIDAHYNKFPHPHYRVILVDDKDFNTAGYFGTVENARGFVSVLVAKGIKLDSAEVDYK